VRILEACFVFLVGILFTVSSFSSPKNAGVGIEPDPGFDGFAIGGG
jgi:hypothetical protein